MINTLTARVTSLETNKHTCQNCSSKTVVPEIIIRGIPVNSPYSHKEILAAIFKKINCDFLVEAVVFKTRDLPNKYSNDGIQNNQSAAASYLQPNSNAQIQTGTADSNLMKTNTAPISNTKGFVVSFITDYLRDHVLRLPRIAEKYTFSDLFSIFNCNNLIFPIYMNHFTFFFLKLAN